MAFMAYPDLILLLVSFISLYVYHRIRKCTTSMPTNWPLLGMTPAVLENAHRLHDYTTDVLKESGCTGWLKGVWFTNMDMLITCDPANIHHMLSKNFHNYPKGPEFSKIFEILGDGIFNSDNELWEMHRKTTMSLLKHVDFHNLLETTIWNKVEQGLFPVLDLMSKQGSETDLQEIFQRFTFDGICKMVLHYDPESLSVEFPSIPCEKAFTITEEALFYRHILPESFWKFQSWIQIGKEKQLNEAWKSLDEFIYRCIAVKQEAEIIHTKVVATTKEEYGLFTGLMRGFKDQGGSSNNPKKFLKDTILNLMVAGRDTTSTALSWFFYLLAKNPMVEEKILEEIHRVQLELGVKVGEKWKHFGVEELTKLVYLHGALCEALRLFPPVAFEHKEALEADVLPSGHEVNKNTKIILSFYSMGRMESIWGEDCMEFKPERWLSERGGGGIKHEPSYKFTAFHAGPRSCLGKEMAFIQMKIVAATIIHNYKVDLVEGHIVTPSDSIILQMKHGLKVKVARRRRSIDQVINNYN